MILRANIRGNGAQLSDYVTMLNENDHVHILDVDGRENANEAYLRQTILSMQFNAELTRSDKPYFNVQMNPAYGEDKTMTRDDWYKAADILAKETGFEHQRRVIVLHTKKGRTHAHIIWERYNHETGKMIDNKHSRLKVDNARPKIEKALGHKATPRRSPARPELRKAVTNIWNNTATGAEFIKQARKAGYMVAEGTANRPFMVVDENGRSFDLVRQLENVRTKEVRARLRNEPLIPEKRAIEIMREEGNKSDKRDSGKVELRPAATQKAKDFAENRFDAFKEDQSHADNRRAENVFNEFKANAADVEDKPNTKIDTEPEERKQKIAHEFADNDLSGKSETPEQQAKRQQIADQQELIRTRRKQHKRHH